MLLWEVVQAIIAQPGQAQLAHQVAQPGQTLLAVIAMRGTTPHQVIARRELANTNVLLG